MNWTDESIAQLKKLWSKGVTTAEIGKQLGISKNAIVGKAHRLKLPGRASPIKRDKIVNAVKEKTPRIYTMADLTSQTCRWPSGDPKHEDFQFCGRPPEQGKVYCSAHCDLGYVATKPKSATQSTLLKTG